MKMPLVVKHGLYLCGLIDNQMFINGLPLEDWLDNFLPDRKRTRDLTPISDTLGYCKECGKALCEHDYKFWNQLLNVILDDAYLLLKFQGHCVDCLCRLAEDSQ